MAGLSTVALDEYRLTFVMVTGRTRRTFVMTIPAASEEHAKNGALGLAYAINDASAHVWKMTGEVTAEAVA